MDDFGMWSLTLALGAVVTIVVAALLAVIIKLAGQINDTVSEIWTVGQRVANNTVHVPVLYRTSEKVGAILATAGGIAGAAGAIETHANGCPGCPQCVLRH
jgi:hypothetical protein